MNKVLILGHQGMLGSDLQQVFYRSGYQTVGWDKEEIDITSQVEVKRKIFSLRPDLIINAAAYTDVDGAEKEFSLAKKVNTIAIGYLVKVCAKIGAVFVHYSTDYVFDGQKKNGYKENDILKNPVNKYGLSKLLGENQILDLRLKISDFKFYLIRTSWLFGSKTEPTEHKNFVNTILKLTREKEELKVVDDQFGKPTYTFDVAQATKKILEKKFPYGIYHLTNEGVTTWYQFAKEIVALNGLKKKIIPCSSTEFSRPAKRPKYSVLINTKGPKLRHWKKALKDYLKSFVKNYKTKLQ